MFHPVIEPDQLVENSKTVRFTLESELKFSYCSYYYPFLLYFLAGVYPYPHAIRFESIAVKPIKHWNIFLCSQPIMYSALYGKGLSAHSYETRKLNLKKPLNTTIIARQKIICANLVNAGTKSLAFGIFSNCPFLLINSSNFRYSIAGPEKEEAQNMK